MKTIDRVKMVDVTIGVTEIGVPFVSDADELHVYSLERNEWFHIDWSDVPRHFEGAIEWAANWMASW